MPRFVRVPLLLLASAACLATGRAQSSPGEAPSVLASPSATASATSSSAPTSSRPKRERAISSGLASSLASTMPKYNPPPKPNPDDEDVDLRDVDKPRNGIIRLPKYTVQEKKPPVFRERDILTGFGFAELAKKRYLTNAYHALNSFYLPLFGQSPESRALAMYAEDERLKNISDLKDNARTVGTADAADAKALRAETDATYLRSADFGFSPNYLRRD